MKAIEYMKKSADLVEKRMSDYVVGKAHIHKKLSSAMLYSLNAGGKRLRPALMFACYEMSGGKMADIADAACAIEMVHTYSLIHDDLPAMDDDDLRRGKPTNHKVFGEGEAILAGDALLTDAFHLLLSGNGKIDFSLKARAAQILAFRAGASGMVSGQYADLENENFNLKKKSKSQLKKTLNYIHSHKTADMIIAACQMGAVLGGKISYLKSMEEFAYNLGLCFQITDDMLDITADKKKLGKSGSDRKNNKLTFVSLFGLEQAAKMAKAAAAKSVLTLSKIKCERKNKENLSNIASFVLGRDR